MSCKNFLYIFLSLILIVFLFACERKKVESKIYVSFYPLEYFIKQIIPDASVETLVQAGVDPHHFEPSIKDIQKLYSSRAIIYLGNTDIDQWIDKIGEDLKQKGIKVLRIQDKLSFREYSSQSELDPHIWLDPVMSLELIRVLRDFASELNPENKSDYERNFKKYAQKLIDLDNIYKDSLSRCLKKDVIVTHEFLNYLSSRYGLKSHFIVHEPEEEISLQKIRKLKEFMRKNSISYIVSETEGEKVAKILSDETKAKILKFDTFHTKTDKDYIEVMRENLVTLKTALNCN